jgi:hypothetical protein
MLAGTYSISAQHAGFKQLTIAGLKLDVGSSLTQDFEPKLSDINTVLLLEAYDIPALNPVAELTPPLSRHKISPPLLVTPFYIDRSRDVFRWSPTSIDPRDHSGRGPVRPPAIR